MNDLSLYSDLYKDAFGFRPKGSFDRVANMGPVDFQNTLDSLSDYANDQYEQQKLASEERLQKLVARVKEMAAEYGVSVETALRWDMDAEGVDGDVDYYLFKQGVSHAGEGTLYGLLEA